MYSYGEWLWHKNIEPLGLWEGMRDIRLKDTLKLLGKEYPKKGIFMAPIFVYFVFLS